MEYMNIYSKPVKRLSCFSEITEEYDDSQESDSEFSGGAQAYEKHLDQILKQLPRSMAPTSSMARYPQKFCDFGQPGEAIYKPSCQHGGAGTQMMPSPYLYDNRVSSVIT